MNHKLSSTFQFLVFLVILSVTFSKLFGQVSQNSPSEGQSTVYRYVEQMPEFPGGEGQIYRFIRNNLKYPEQAKLQNISGRVFLRFVINETGDVTNVQLVQGLGYGCDEAALAVVKAMPKWTPGKQAGKPVSVQYSLPIVFNLKSDNDKPSVNATGAQFPGGEESLKDFIATNLRFPEHGKLESTDARSILVFQVDEHGHTSAPQVQNSLGRDFDKELFRFYKLLPKSFVPAEREGKKVQASFVLPVDFSTLKK